MMKNSVYVSLLLAGMLSACGGGDNSTNSATPATQNTPAPDSSGSTPAGSGTGGSAANNNGSAGSATGSTPGGNGSSTGTPPDSAGTNGGSSGSSGSSGGGTSTDNGGTTNQQPVRWTVTDLGPMQFQNPARSLDTVYISNSGKVLITYSSEYSSQAYIWDAGQTTQVTYPSLPYTMAFGINDSGQVLAKAYDQRITNGGPQFFNNKFFIYQNGNATALDFGSDIYLPSTTKGLHFNNAGQITFATQFPNQTGSSVALYSNGTTKNVGTADINYAPTPVGINDKGEIAGTQYSYYYQPSQGFFFDGTRMTTLTSFPADVEYAEVKAINNNSQIIGNMGRLGSNPHGFLQSGGAVKDLGLLMPTAISDLGQIVGRKAMDSNNDANTQYHVVYLANGQEVDLTTEPSIVNAGWVIDSAQGINKQGKIVGTGKLNGEQHFYLLTPVYQ